MKKPELIDHIMSKLGKTYLPSSGVYQNVFNSLPKLSRDELSSLLTMLISAREATKTHYKVTIIAIDTNAHEKFHFTFGTYATSKEQAIENTKLYYDFSELSITTEIADKCCPDAIMISKKSIKTFI